MTNPEYQHFSFNWKREAPSCGRTHIPAQSIFDVDNTIRNIHFWEAVDTPGSTVSFSFSFSSSSFLSNAHFKPFFEVLRKRQVLFSFLFSLLFSISRKFFLWPFFTSYSGLRDEQIGRQKRGLLKRKTLHQRVADTRFLQNFIANILKNYGARK